MIISLESVQIGHLRERASPAAVEGPGATLPEPRNYRRRGSGRSAQRRSPYSPVPPHRPIQIDMHRAGPIWKIGPKSRFAALPLPAMEGPSLLGPQSVKTLPAQARIYLRRQDYLECFIGRWGGPARDLLPFEHPSAI